MPIAQHEFSAGSARNEGKSVERTISFARTCATNREGMTPVEAVDSVQDPPYGRLTSGSVSLPGEESSNIEVAFRDGGSSTNPIGKARSQETAEKGTEPRQIRNGLVTIPATQSGLLEICKGYSNSVFSGYIFGLLDPTPSEQVRPSQS